VWVLAWAWVCADLDLSVVAWWLTVGNGLGFVDLDGVVVCLLTLILIWLFWMTFDFDFG
jgi:hypothetical protein